MKVLGYISNLNPISGVQIISYDSVHLIRS